MPVALHAGGRWDSRPAAREFRYNKRTRTPQNPAVAQTEQQG
jgi:hypothetical protein